jgi:methionyl-tRNA formyltransferase
LSAHARVVFAGTPEFAVPSLRRLAESDLRVAGVLTQPDRPAGRGRRLTASPVKIVAQSLGLAVRQPASLRDPALLGELGHAPDLLVVVAYGLLLPQRLLDWPRLGCINLHASLLPRWRGAAPIQHAILEGDAVTGVSLMQIVRELDAGPVYAQRSLPIGSREIAGGLHDRLAELGAALLAATLPQILDGDLEAVPQREDLVTYAPKIAKSDAPLDWHAAAYELERRVRAFNPWPVAEARLSDGRRLRVWQAEALADDSAVAPGTIVAAGAAGIDVATGDGVLRLTRVQPPSARVLDVEAYLAAHVLGGVSFVC